VPTRGCCRFPGAERVGSVVSQTEFARRSNRLAKCTCTMDLIADRVELGFLEISRDRRRPGNSQPARGFLATCKSRSNYTAFDRSFVRERAPEFFRGWERAETPIPGKPPKLNDVCYRLWLRESLWPAERIKPSVVYMLVGTQSPRLSEIVFSGIN
jgi:hypothetical protein